MYNGIMHMCYYNRSNNKHWCKGINGGKIMVAVIDYGAGNIYSVLNRLKSVGAECALTCDKRVMERADGLVLPGVGAFGYAADMLQGLGLNSFIKEQALNGKPLLGICLGMQLLFNSSEESVGAEGLGLIDGKVTRIKSGALKIPHIGWTSLENTCGRLMEGVTSGEYFYFVHSYGAHCTSSANSVATSTYGETFDVVVEKNNIFGTQFHPEKSSYNGKKIIDNFVKMVENYKQK